MTYQKPKPHIVLLNGRWDYWCIAKSDGRTTNHVNPQKAAHAWCNRRNVAECRRTL